MVELEVSYLTAIIPVVIFITVMILLYGMYSQNTYMYNQSENQESSIWIKIGYYLYYVAIIGMIFGTIIIFAGGFVYMIRDR